MIKIITVYTSTPQVGDRERPVAVDMSYGRWCNISDSLARSGYQVAMAIADRFFEQLGKAQPSALPSQVRMIPLSKVKWDEYDVVKTEFHEGFDTLKTYGGDGHPFIISKLGSVVGPLDMDGICFYSEIREGLYNTQVKINQTSRYITVLSEPAGEIWQACFGARNNLLLVPGGADRDIPAPGVDPYPDRQKKRCLFAGNIYNRSSQPEANVTLVDKLNRLGELLLKRGVRLYMVGHGDLQQLDKQHVTYLGSVTMDQCWNYMYHADVGAVVSAWKFMHNNESSKIYHYLRAGLPVVSESGFPNDHIIRESKLGEIVENGNMESMAEHIEETAQRKDWNREYAMNYILNHHTWDQRVQVYDKLFKKHFK